MILSYFASCRTAWQYISFFCSLDLKISALSIPYVFRLSLVSGKEKESVTKRELFHKMMLVWNGGIILLHAAIHCH